MRYITDVIHYFNPRSPHGERRKTAVKAMEKAFISIHAPRTGSDYIWQCGLYVGGISIHAPRTGSDRDRDWLANFARQFQSTLPARGATERIGK